MLSEWLAYSKKLAMTEADFKMGSKKIFRERKLRITRFDDPVDIHRVGYQKTKLSLLKKLYVHEESLSSAVDQWETRTQNLNAYGSVGFSCYNHILKPHSGESANKSASKMGPCLQAVTLTQVKGQTCAVDVFYRTTELYKKFPADLVLLNDVLLPRFNFTRAPLESVTCHFANVTVGPIYLSVILTVMPDDPITFLEDLREADPSFHRSSLVWISRYLGGGYYKFKQIRRNGDAMLRVMDKSRINQLSKYINSLKVDDTEELDEGEEP